MILGTQWYILFNVIAGASAFPGDLQEAARNFRVGGWLWWRRVILPGVFPYYVTGAITASGGSWNAAIVSEVASWGDTKLTAHGLGRLHRARRPRTGNTPKVVLGVAVMSRLRDRVQPAALAAALRLRDATPDARIEDGRMDQVTAATTLLEVQRRPPVLPQGQQRRPRGAGRRRPDAAARRDRGAAGPVRLGQVDAAAHHRRAADADQRAR